MRPWSIVTLDGAQSWSPSHFLGFDQPAVVADRSDHVIQLGEIAKVVPAGVVATAGDSVVNPRDVSRDSGAVVSVRPGAGELCSALGRGLEVGDVLCPRVSSRPCVLLTPQHRGLLFTRDFIALRIDAAHADPSVVWALLSSGVGQSAREALASGVAVPRLQVAALMAIRIGLTPQDELPSLRSHLPDPVVALTRRPSWESAWSFVDLRSVPAWRFCAIADAGNKDDRTLKDIAAISRPPKLRPVPSAEPGRLLPLIGRRSFSTLPALKPQEWTTADGTTTTTDDAIIVRATGIPRAGIAPKGHLLTDEVLLLELRETGGLSQREAALRLALCLNSPGGQRELDSQSAGIAARRLSCEALAGVRIPPWSRMPLPESNARPLAIRLDEVLFREQQ